MSINRENKSRLFIVEIADRATKKMQTTVMFCTITMVCLRFSDQKSFKNYIAVPCQEINVLFIFIKPQTPRFSSSYE